jgi:hypothetical protein
MAAAAPEKVPPESAPADRPALKWAALKWPPVLGPSAGSLCYHASGLHHDGYPEIRHFFPQDNLPQYIAIKLQSNVKVFKSR